MFRNKILNFTNLSLLIALIGQQLGATSTQTPLKCYQCDTRTLYNCLDLYTVSSTVCPDDSTKCFVKNVDGNIKRGCLKDSDTTTCPHDDDDPNCFVCSESGCNDHRICKKCEAADPNCSQTSVYENAYNQICEASDTKCFANVRDGKVERRCATDDDSCGDSTTCSLCIWTNCNAGTFPTKRIQCYQCSGPDCNNVPSSQHKAMPCPSYVDGDECYSLGHNNTSMQRGCMSDVDEASTQSQDLVTCHTSQCNGFPYERNQTIKCIHCSGAGKEADCLQQHVVEAAKSCQQKLWYGDTDACYTLQKGVTIRRGCLNDDPKVREECRSPEWCKTCGYNGCNRDEETIAFTCIACRSDMNQECWNNAHQVEGQRCRTGESSEDEGCFHGIWSGVVIRGCAIDLDERSRNVCQDLNDNQCHICRSKDCNVGQSSGVGSIIFNVGLLIVAPMVRWASGYKYL